MLPLSMMVLCWLPLGMGLVDFGVPFRGVLSGQGVWRLGGCVPGRHGPALSCFMAQQKTGPGPGEEIIDTDVSEELNTSFLEYAMSVIVARALPDVRDGLKPVHRRILFSLYEQGIRPGTPYKKCARVVGNVIGKYHPHGDSAVYEAMVRMAQPWSMRLMLVDGHGNFGSLDDGPAAMRYTEARMASPAMVLVEELGEDTVDMSPNYDNTEQEPSVMPAAFPNLLVNGSTGIAVGMATNMAPHNLAEVVSGVRAMIANPSITLEEMLTHVQGPDLPSGGIIVGLDGIREAYATGRGSFKIRAVAQVTDVSARRKGIVITELPYTVGPERVVARIKELVNAKKLPGISDVKDFSDRKVGLRLVVECKTGFNPHAVLDELYRLTPLEESFGINAVALVGGEPRTLGLLDLCRFFIEHRVTVVRRRSEFRLRKAEARAHILRGLIKALDVIDEVVALIRASKDTASARAKLMKFLSIDEVQADAILEMTLRRLTSLEISRLKDELKSLEKIIKELLALLASPAALANLVSEEVGQVGSAFADPRRTRLLASVPTSSVDAESLEVPDDPCTVVLSSSGLVGRFASGPHKGRVSKADVVLSQVVSSNRSVVGAVTSTGRLVRLSSLELPVADQKSSRGLKASEVFGLDVGEVPVGLVDARPGNSVFLVTMSGLFKQVVTDEFPQKLDSRPAIKLDAGDEVVAALCVPSSEVDSCDLLAVSSAGQLLRSSCAGVPAKGLAAGGVKGVKLADGSRVVAAGLLAQGVSDVFVAVASDGPAVKVSAAQEYPVKGRGTAGVRCMTFRKNESAVVAAVVGALPLLALDSKGSLVEVDLSPQRRDASGVSVEVPVALFGSVRLH